MRDYYKNKATNDLFRFWICNHPESYHQLDMERFYEFLLSVFSTGEELSADILTSAIKEEKKWIDKKVIEVVDRYMDKYWDIKHFWDYVKKR